MDGRKQNGAKRGEDRGAGRKPKSDEILLISKLQPHEDSVILKLNELANNGDMQAIKLFMEYLHGKPKQIIESDNTHTFNDFDLREFLKFKKKNDRTP